MSPEVKGSDDNCRLHVDTYMPAWKVWLYAEDVQDRHGPFTLVPGTHVSSEAKLRWLYSESNNVAKHGPGSYGSFRMDTSLEDWDALPETSFGMPARRGITGGKMSLLIADTSALHARGLSDPGTVRRTFVLHGDANDGGLPRRNPFSYIK